MQISRGKKFEGVVKEAFEKLKYVSIDRYPDPAMGYAGIQNICDFGVYSRPFFYYIECKAFSGNTLNFKSAITENQWSGMLEKSKIEGVVAGIMVWFIDHDQTEFVPIQELVRLRNTGSASLNIRHIIEGQVTHIPVEGVKKRVYYNYDMVKFLEQADKWCRNYWGGTMNGR